MSLVGTRRMTTWMVTKKLARMTHLITKVHAGDILEPLGAYLIGHSCLDDEDHADFAEIASASRAKLEQYREEHILELSHFLLPSLRDNSTKQQLEAEKKRLERVRLKKRMEATLESLEGDKEVLGIMMKNRIEGKN